MYRYITNIAKSSRRRFSSVIAMANAHVCGGGGLGGGATILSYTVYNIQKKNEGHDCAAGDNLSRPEKICLHKNVQTVMCYFVVRRSLIHTVISLVQR